MEALNHSAPSRVLNARGEGLLTPREDQVVRLVAEGIGNREVALQLGIKENTVKKSLLRIYDKLGVSNRVELVLYSLTHSGANRSTPSINQSQTDMEVAVECMDPRHVGAMEAAFGKNSEN